jgi:hypothetical protein
MDILLTPPGKGLLNTIQLEHHAKRKQISSYARTSEYTKDYIILLLYGKHQFRWNGGLWLAVKHFQRSNIFRNETAVHDVKTEACVLK